MKQRQFYADLNLLLWCCGFLCGAEMGHFYWLYRVVAATGAIAAGIITVRFIREFKRNQREFEQFMREMRQQYPQYEWPSTKP